jgi:radical SAM protein with 4Fe4S-binding SPASM domain
MKSSNDFESRSLPKTFVLELTRRCNNHCLYCYNEGGAVQLNFDSSRNGEMGTAELTDLIAKLRAETPIETIALSGGEPLLREDLAEILSFIKAKGIAPVVITNGTLLTREKVAATMEGVTYEVTLLSYREQVHDKLAGRRGAWNAAVDGMINIRRARGSFVAVFVATKLNCADLCKTAELCIALGADAIMYNRINLGTHNMGYVDRLLPTPDLIRENLDVLDRMAAQYGLPVAVSVVIEPCVLDVRKYQHIHFGWCPLAGEGSYFTIDPLGNLRICNHSPVILGNIRREHFSDIYYNNPYIRRFRETWPDECNDCASVLKQMCCGGCRASAEQCYGTPARIDPFVTLSRQLATQTLAAPRNPPFQAGKRLS